jgi:threonine dehydratase
MTTPVTHSIPTREAIEQTYALIQPYVRVTPILHTSGASLGGPEVPVVFKLEQLQHSGSFKARGAFANLKLRQVPAAGVVAASGGNHGVAVAYAASQLGIPAHIFVPTVSSPAKIDRIRRLGAALTVTGDRYVDALAASQAFAQSSGALQVHAYDQLETILGQATLGLELARQAEVDTVIAAVGGGGHIAGIAAWYRGSTRVIGVEPRLAPTLFNALEAGHPVDAPMGSVAADSLAPKRVGELTFPIAQAHVEKVVLVDDDDILRAQAALWDSARIVAEPGGATACAALLSGAYRPAKDERVAVIVCGGNTTAVTFPSATPSPGASSSPAPSRG